MSNYKENQTFQADSQTAFILGNGPSLKGFNLEALSDYCTIGLNAAYRYWQKIDWRPTHYACLDEVVGISHKDAIKNLILEGRIQQFLLRENLIQELGELACQENVRNFDAIQPQEALFADPSVTTGSHSALWAGVLGYKTIVILGVDANYVEKVEGSQKGSEDELKIVENRANPNYFFDDYQLVGDTYNIPNPRPDLHVNAWHSAGQKLTDADCYVFNGNPQSKVQCFPFIDIQDFLSDEAAIVPATENYRDIPSIAPSHLDLPKTSKEKLVHFFKSNLKHLLAIGSIWFGGAIWLAQHEGSLPSQSLLAGLCFLALGHLYSRHAILNHLHALQYETDQLRATVNNLMRKQS